MPGFSVSPEQVTLVHELVSTLEEELSRPRGSRVNPQVVVEVLDDLLGPVNGILSGEQRVDRFRIAFEAAKSGD